MPAKVGSGCRIREVCVDSLIISTEPRPEAVVIGMPSLAAYACAGIDGIEISSFKVQRSMRTAGFRFSSRTEDLHDSDHSIGAKERRLRATHNFDVIDIRS